MNNLNQAIPCPVCETKIPFDAKQLLMGTKFSCPNCSANIGIAQESKPQVKDALEKFESIKNHITHK